jgi:hypothetical protein
MKPFWVIVMARPAVGLLAREVHAEMTALFAVTATPAPGTDLVRTNNQDAAYTGRHGNHADRDPPAPSHGCARRSTATPNAAIRLTLLSKSALDAVLNRVHELLDVHVHELQGLRESPARS